MKPDLVNSVFINSEYEFVNTNYGWTEEITLLTADALQSLTVFRE